MKAHEAKTYGKALVIVRPFVGGEYSVESGQLRHSIVTRKLPGAKERAALTDCWGIAISPRRPS